MRREPMIVHGPAATSTAAMTGAAKSRVEAASARPMTSSVRRRTLATTSAGSMSKRRAAVNVASFSASVMRRSLFGEGDVAVLFAAPDRRDRAAFGVRHLELLDEPRVEHLLDELFALLARGRELVRFPSRDEIPAADVRQARLGALQLEQRAVDADRSRRGGPRRERRERAVAPAGEAIAAEAAIRGAALHDAAIRGAAIGRVRAIDAIHDG